MLLSGGSVTVDTSEEADFFWLASSLARLSDGLAGVMQGIRLSTSAIGIPKSNKYARVCVPA